MQVQICSRRETGKEIPESSRLEFLEKYSANNFALSDAEDNTSGLLNSRGIADLPLLRRLFLWSAAAAQAAKNHGEEWGLTWYFRWEIYTPIPTWTHSQKSLAAAEAPNLNISSHGKSLKWSQRWSNDAQTETTTWSEFPNGGKASVEQILASEERYKSERAGLWQS